MNPSRLKTSRPAASQPPPWTRRRLLLAGAASLGGAGAGTYLVRRLWPDSWIGGSPVTVPVEPPPPRGPVPVLIETDPPGANLVLHPVNYLTGRVEPRHRIVVDGVSPAELKLMEGDYLVGAYFDDGRFHEVYRHVPGPEGPGFTLGFSHFFSSKQDDGRIRLPEIEIPAEAPVVDMVPIAESAAYTMIPFYPQDRLRKYSVPAFLVDQYEFTQGTRWDISPRYQHRDDFLTDGREFPLRHQNSFDHFVALAEGRGKRLLTDIEFSYVASNAGTTRYPWGNDMHPSRHRRRTGPEADRNAQLGPNAARTRRAQSLLRSGRMGRRATGPRSRGPASFKSCPSTATSSS